MNPTIGRIVHYTLTQADCDVVVRRLGFQANQVGSDVEPGDVVPMIVTRVISSVDKFINGQAFMDGNDSLWIVSARESDEFHGCWFWPPREG